MIEELIDHCEVVRYRRGGQRGQKSAPVAHRPQPRVEDGQDAAILAVPDQPSEPLLQRQDRQRDLVLAEGVARRPR